MGWKCTGVNDMEKDTEFCWYKRRLKIFPDSKCRRILMQTLGVYILFGFVAGRCVFSRKTEAVCCGFMAAVVLLFGKCLGAQYCHLLLAALLKAFIYFCYIYSLVNKNQNMWDLFRTAALGTVHSCLGTVHSCMGLVLDRLDNRVYGLIRSGVLKVGKLIVRKKLGKFWVGHCVWDRVCKLEVGSTCQSYLDRKQVQARVCAQANQKHMERFGVKNNQFLHCFGAWMCNVKAGIVQKVRLCVKQQTYLIVCGGKYKSGQILQGIIMGMSANKNKNGYVWYHMSINFEYLLRGYEWTNRHLVSFVQAANYHNQILWKQQKVVLRWEKRMSKHSNGDFKYMLVFISMFSINVCVRLGECPGQDYLLFRVNYCNPEACLGGGSSR